MRVRSQAPRARSGAAAVELALTLPLILSLLTGLWEVGRAIEVHQMLTNCARDAARIAATGNCTNAQVQQLAKDQLKLALYDTSGTMTANVTVTIDNLNAPGTEVSAATVLDPITVTVTVPFNDVRWINVALVTNSSSKLSAQVVWPCMKDADYPTTTPPPPQG